MASNRALKLPAPKPRGPSRWMISKKSGGPVGDGLGEDLEEVAVVVAVDQDAEAARVVPRQVDAGHARLGVVVVRGRDPQEAHAPVRAGPRTGGDDVVGAQGDVLHAGAAVAVEVLLDLALAPALGRLVDGQDDLATRPTPRSTSAPSTRWRSGRRRSGRSWSKPRTRA